MAQRAEPRGVPPERLAWYEALVGALPGIERKGATMPYTALNGHMFTFLAPTGALAVRLSRERRDAFLAAHPAATCEQHGRVLKDYVTVPSVVEATPGELAALLRESLAHVSTLKPKPTTRPR